ncbi:hypothetical protein J7J39_02515, partial [bacterium]|nr:hypothetical protein [bacterium]
TDEIGRVIYFFEGPPPLSSPLEKGEDYLPQILPLPLGGGGFRWGRDSRSTLYAPRSPLPAPRSTLEFCFAFVIWNFEFCITQPTL